MSAELEGRGRKQSGLNLRHYVDISLEGGERYLGSFMIENLRAEISIQGDLNTKQDC